MDSGRTVILGEMGVARVNPQQPGQSEPLLPSACFSPNRPAAVTQCRGGGDDSRSPSYAVDDVHQARLTKGVGEWGMTFGEDKKRDRLRAERGNQRFLAATAASPAQLTAFHAGPPPTPHAEGAVLAIKQ